MALTLNKEKVPEPGMAVPLIHRGYMYVFVENTVCVGRRIKQVVKKTKQKRKIAWNMISFKV